MTIRHACVCIAMLLLPCACAPAPAADTDVARCPAEGAQYRLLADPHYRISLDASPEPDTASDLRVHLQGPQAHTFSFAMSSGYGQVWLLPVPHDEHDDAPLPGFFSFDEDMTALDDPPQSDRPAPAWLFIPELGPRLWYAPPDGSGNERGYMPTAMFRLESCR